MAGRMLSRDEIAELNIALQTLGMTNGIIQPTHRIRQMPRKGMGVRAEKFLKQGTLILAEQPTFSILGCEGDTNDWTPGNIAEIQREALRHPEFSTLHCPRNRRGQRRGSALRRFEANNIEMNDNTHLRGIFLSTSRINHSCVPNAYFDYNGLFGCLTVYAIQNIPEGEEITVSYISRDWHKTTDERQAELRDIYRFTCTCRLCHGQSRVQDRTEITRLWHERNTYNIRQQHTPAERYQNLYRLVSLRNAIEFEHLFYPALAEACEWVAKAFKSELDRPQNRAVFNHEDCRNEIRDAARLKLVMDVMATGQNSQVVINTLAWMMELR